MTRIAMLSEIGIVKTGKTPSKNNPEFWGDKAGFITPSDFTDSKYVYASRRISQAGVNALRNVIVPRRSVLVTCIGSDMGKVARVEEESVITNQQINTLIVNTSIADADFIYYSLKAKYELLRNLGVGSGSTMPIINKTTFEKIKIELPNLETQKKIANILGSLDEKIELNRRMNETLEQLGQALFRHYFVDNPAAADWDIVSLTELCDRIASGGTPSTRNDNYYGGDIQWYSTKELKDNFVFCSEKTITDDGLNESSAKLFPVNTVMMAIYAAPTVGRLGILTQEAAFNQATCGLVAKPSVGYEFIYLYLLLSRSDLNNMANGAAQQNISVGKVRNFAVMKPDDQTILKFKEKIQPIFEKIKRNSEETITLTSMRDSLLPKLISGEIEV